MRKSPVLLKQHIGYHFYKHWVIQGKRKPIDTGAEKILKHRGIPVFSPDEILKEKKSYERVKVVGFRDYPPPLDNTHPDWHDRALLSYKDHNVPLEGLKQAKIITNAVEIGDLNENLKITELPKEVDKAFKKAILSSQLFDAEQIKLPKVKDPKRPAWNFPRTYGIGQERRNKLITQKVLNLLESISDRHIVKQRYIFEDLLFSYPFERNGNLVQIELCGNSILTSSKPLSPISRTSTEQYDVPDMSPIDPLITFNKENIYKIRDIWPLKPTLKLSHPHTVFIHFDREVVKNLYEEEVTEQQIFGRSLLKAFTVAASYARQKYGKDVTKLENPITIQSVQTDGHFFHLGVFQLNNLDLENKNTKNVWYQTPLQYLYDNCSYVSGKPSLEGYNNQIIRQLHCFYNNV